MEEHEIKKMGIAELAKYMDEQIKLGSKKERTQKEIADIRGISRKTLNKQTDPFREKGELEKAMNEQSSTLETREGTPIFTDSEIKVLKNVIKERERDIQLFHEYRIYKELEKVPTNAEHVRSAFNMSKETTERLKKFSSVRRIPLQDLVELAVIDLLGKYDK